MKKEMFGWMLFIVFVTFILTTTIYEYVKNEEVSCRKVCNAQGLTYSQIDKDMGFCICKDVNDKLYISKYFRMES